METSKWKNKLSKSLAMYSHVKEQAREEELALANIREHISHVEVSQRVLQEIAEGLQSSAISQIASIVNKCLQAIFDNAYVFEIRFEKKRGKTEARLVLSRDGLGIEDPMNSLGGGVIDIVSFSLRLASLVLSKPYKRKLLCLDECFSKLKPGELYGPRVVSMLETLSEEMGVQFIMVQNLEDFQAGKVIQIT